jgi:hypothetical protein
MADGAAPGARPPAARWRWRDHVAVLAISLATLLCEIRLQHADMHRCALDRRSVGAGRCVGLSVQSGDIPVEFSNQCHRRYDSCANDHCDNGDTGNKIRRRRVHRHRKPAKPPNPSGSAHHSESE